MDSESLAYSGCCEHREQHSFQCHRSCSPEDRHQWHCSKCRGAGIDRQLQYQCFAYQEIAASCFDSWWDRFQYCQLQLGRPHAHGCWFEVSIGIGHDLHSEVTHLCPWNVPERCKCWLCHHQSTRLWCKDDWCSFQCISLCLPRMCCCCTWKIKLDCIIPCWSNNENFELPQNQSLFLRWSIIYTPNAGIRSYHGHDSTTCKHQCSELRSNGDICVLPCISCSWLPEGKHWPIIFQRVALRHCHKFD